MLPRLLLACAALAPLGLAAWAMPWALRARIAALAALALAGAALLALDPLAVALARVDGILSAPGCGG
ncbi:hypothetical protein D8I24_2442 [Cupriavidus necator H850]|jgi:hypothetical protein|uniref:hypothetical protein n=1 Tax=Cupriavidus TaxID=106589 RepID=UPI00129D4CB8|nr:MULTISPECIES: hypothetical protein [Cupriavidus]KAI3605650.1 hypothetical protein D8I24_2442 [Cupriavidus necator H850]QUN28665.1 hypothetical protein KB879_01440 [Cupriavidus sp. KK10]